MLPSGPQCPLTVAIIGAGMAGRSIAAEAVRAGYHVVLEDVMPSKLRTALDTIATAGQPGTLALVSTVEDAVRDADLVIDFVPDELESKLEIVSMVDRMAPPKTILCIPTYALSIADLASCTYRADRCAGVQLSGQNVVVFAGPSTSAATLSQVVNFWSMPGRTVLAKTEELTSL